MIHCKMLFNDSTMGKREVERIEKIRDVRKYSSQDLCSVVFWLFVHLSAFIPKSRCRETSQVTFQCQLIGSTHVP